jgi:chemotaxis protein MotB
MKCVKYVAGTLAGVALLAGCSNKEELLQEKDRIITERSAENDALKRQLRDAEATRLVMQKQVDAQRAEVEEANAVAAAAKSAAPLAPVEAAAAAKPVAKARPFQFKDKDVEVVSQGDTGTLLRLNTKDMFASGSAEVTPAGRKILGRVAKALAADKNCNISIEGHTDDTPIKKSAAKWKTNEALSLARAESVKACLVKEGNLSEESISCTGLGETKPIATGKTDAARARNRRVEIIVSR